MYTQMHNQNCFSFFSQVIHYKYLMLDVQVVRRFIKDNRITALCNRSCQKHHFPFTTGQAQNTSFRQMHNVHFFKSSVYDFPFISLLSGFFSSGRCGIIQSHLNHITHGKVKRHRNILSHIPYHRGYFFCCNRKCHFRPAGCFRPSSEQSQTGFSKV